MDKATDTGIYRETIVGFVVINDCMGAGNYCSAYTEPFCIGSDGLGNNISIDKKCDIIGVLPAPAGAYRVYGFDNEGHEVELGHEYPGAYHPNWEDELEAKRNEA